MIKVTTQSNNTELVFEENEILRITQSPGQTGSTLLRDSNVTIAINESPVDLKNSYCIVGTATDGTKILVPSSKIKVLEVDGSGSRVLFVGNSSSIVFSEPIDVLQQQTVTEITASNLGAGEGVFKQKTDNDLEFKSLVAGSNITIVSAGDDLTINSTTGGIGSADNGLYLDGSTAKLGTNPLVENTDIQLSTFNLDINSANVGAFNGLGARFADSFGFAVTTGNLGSGTETTFFALNNQIKYGYKTPTTNAQIEGQTTRLQLLYSGPLGLNLIDMEDGSISLSTKNLVVEIDSTDQFKAGKVLTQTGLNGETEFKQLYNISSSQWEKFGTLPVILANGQVANGFTFFDNVSDKISAGTTSYDEYDITFGIDLTLTGTSGTANINVDGVNYLATFNTSLAQTAQDFIATWGAALKATGVIVLYNGGSPLNPNGNETIRFCASETSCNSVAITTATGDLSGTRINSFTGVNAAAQDHVLIPYEGKPYENQRIHHTFRVNFEIATGSQQTLALSLRRYADDSIIGSEIQIFRTPDVAGQQHVFETYTAGPSDPFVSGGFYFALRNDSGVSVDIQGDIGILLQNNYNGPLLFP